ncbi:MAG: 4Fe-4S binding protein [Treponema sp.]|nr:4Fe-4S binding protein [Treponema sp.]
MSLLPITKTIIGSLFKKYATLPYPFKPMPKDPLVRGQITIGINECIFCGICSKKCPTHAIEVMRNNKSWEISRFNCIQCGECVSVCPKKCLHMIPELTGASKELTKYKAVATVTAAPAAAVPTPAAAPAAAAPAAAADSGAAPAGGAAGA